MRSTEYGVLYVDFSGKFEKRFSHGLNVYVSSCWSSQLHETSLEYGVLRPSKASPGLSQPYPVACCCSQAHRPAGVFCKWQLRWDGHESSGVVNERN